jgi:cytochrome c
MQSSTLRRLVLLVLFGITLYLVYGNDGAQRLVLLAAESPLLQPWPTPVVDYPPQLEGLALAAAPQTQTVGISFLFRSPLALPTPLPDHTPPVTTLTVAGEAGGDGWLRSPASLAFVLADDSGAGVSEYRLAGLSDWTEREYYYPPPVLAEEGVYTLEYRSLDMARNAEAPQSAQIRIDLTPPQLDAPLLDGNLLPNGWFNTPVTLHLAAEGQHRLDYRAVDASGRLGATETLTVAIDLTPPVIQATFPSDLEDGNINLTAFYTISESTGGLARTTVLLNGAPYQPGQPLDPGDNLLVIHAVDGAGLHTEQVYNLAVGARPLYLPLVLQRP